MKSQKSLIPLIERLCKAIEGLREDLRPELCKTESMKRLKREGDALRKEASKTVKKFNANFTRASKYQVDND